jgi:predicted lactoylglutathione lyase
MFLPERESQRRSAVMIGYVTLGTNELPRSASVGNGTMVAFQAKDPAQVDRLPAIALDHGGSDEGAPGLRGGGFYAAYFRDPDGNKLNAFCMPGPGHE